MAKKIDKAGVGEEVFELRSKGYSFRSIADSINSTHKTSLTHMDVKRYLDTDQEKKYEIASYDDDTRAKALSEVRNQMKDLVKIKDEIWELVTELKRNDDTSNTRVLALDRAIKLVEIMNKITSNIQKTPNTVTINNKTNILSISKEAGEFRDVLNEYVKKNNLVIITREEYDELKK